MQSHRNRVLKNVVSSILVVLIFFFAFVTIVNVAFNALYLKTPVKGFSMRPTINTNVDDNKPKQNGDTIYVNMGAPFTNNDIVIAEVDWPMLESSCIIKRVVGTPGDRIEIRDETTHFAVYVNNKVLYTKEKYGNNYSFPKTGSYAYYENYLAFLNNPMFEDSVVEENGTKYIQLKENEYFLMGDNWGYTTDSIEKGPIKANDILGKVELIVDIENDNPFVPILFFMKKLFS